MSSFFRHGRVRTRIPFPAVDRSGQHAPPRYRHALYLLGLLAAYAAPGVEASQPKAGAQTTAADAGSILTLRQAIDHSLAADPRLKAGALGIQAVDGRVAQAGLSPNPEASIEVEDSLGSGGYHGFSRTQTTLQISQLFELGNKLERRVEAAGASRRVAVADQEVLRLDVMAGTTEAYVAMLGAQKRLTIAESRLDRAGRLIPALKRQVQAGASSPVEVTRAEVSVNLARIEVDRARATAAAARRKLASRLGPGTLSFASVAGDLNRVTPPPPLGVALADLDSNPKLVRWNALGLQRDAELGVQRSLATPDLTVGIGPRRYSETNDTGVVFSLSMPIPVNNRNQGAIIEARRELERVGQDKEAARDALYRDISDAYGELQAAWDEIGRLKNAVLPSARKAMSGVESGYGQGRFGVIDLLDAQNTLSEAESRLGDALVAYHSAVAKIESLTARPLSNQAQSRD
jgi:cobalt-zinc-cadmium efflux system outer membrane protein